MVILVDPLYTCATMHEKDDVSNYICIGNERLQGGATAKTIYATTDALVALLGMRVAGGVNRMIVKKKHIPICFQAHTGCTYMYIYKKIYIYLY
jgi:hypothetical protein